MNLLCENGISTKLSHSRLRKNYVGTPERRWSARTAQQKNIFAGCSKRPFSKAAASEEARRTLRYVEPLSDARTLLADFLSILPGLLDRPHPSPLDFSQPCAPLIPKRLLNALP